jgi:two-component system chemotaxis sensor kinase CheA
MFFEEARELLAGLETGLGGLDPAAVDQSRLNEVYRSAHSLKGAAAMVGLATISDLAKEMEQALSRVRSGAAAWTVELRESLTTQLERLTEMVQREEAQFRE